MKKILFTILILSTGTLIRAQNVNDPAVIKQELPVNTHGLEFGVSINPGLSVGSAGSKFVLGGELTLYKHLIRNLEATGSAKLTRFFYNLKDIQNEMLISIQPGIQYDLNKSFYVGAQAGVALSTTDGGAYFVYSPAVGVKISKQFGAGLKFDRFSNKSSVLGLTMTYKFG
ncbi:hypothetical protein [Pedobacter sp. KLB.chiD]|uniref:hypothetical protein n=1 Tax=Pedobacter sp. KLB.chiD TaxID=3387402 RepID=UPI00399BD683